MSWFVLAAPLSLIVACGSAHPVEESVGSDEDELRGTCVAGVDDETIEQCALDGRGVPSIYRCEARPGGGGRWKRAEKCAGTDDVCLSVGAELTCLSKLGACDPSREGKPYCASDADGAPHGAAGSVWTCHSAVDALTGAPQYVYAYSGQCDVGECVEEDIYSTTLGRTVQRTECAADGESLRRVGRACDENAHCWNRAEMASCEASPGSCLSCVAGRCQ